MRIFLCIYLFLYAAASAQTNPARSLPKFEDVAKQIGITVSHISSPEKRYIVESISGGAGLIDCGNDGMLDIITVNGSTVDRYKKGGDQMITLYHQGDNLKFTDITAQAGSTGSWAGCRACRAWRRSPCGIPSGVWSASCSPN